MSGASSKSWNRGSRSGYRHLQTSLEDGHYQQQQLCSVAIILCMYFTLAVLFVLFLFVQCEVPSGFLQLAGQIVLLLFNFLLIIFGVFLAYLTQNVDSTYNKSKYIAYAVRANPSADFLDVQ